MGGSTGSIAARRGLALAAALLLAGCASSNVQFSTGTPQPSVSAQGSSTLGTLILLGVMGGLAYDSEQNAVHFGPPPLDPQRRVLEVDCTKPIEDWSANLRCR